MRQQSHYYQPMFTMIGGGMKKVSESLRPMRSVLPKHVKWICDSATEINPITNVVTTNTGQTIEYEMLLIAVGLELKYGRVCLLLMMAEKR